jgi:hypothetical protein
VTHSTMDKQESLRTSDHRFRMLNSQHYRAKAAEYQDRASATDNLDEIREFKNLERTFGELADNAEWVEKNSEKIVHAPGKGIHHR